MANCLRIEDPRRSPESTLADRDLRSTRSSPRAPHRGRRGCRPASRGFALALVTRFECARRSAAMQATRKGPPRWASPCAPGGRPRSVHRAATTTDCAASARWTGHRKEQALDHLDHPCDARHRQAVRTDRRRPARRRRARRPHRHRLRRHLPLGHPLRPATSGASIPASRMVPGHEIAGTRRRRRRPGVTPLRPWATASASAASSTPARECPPCRLDR